MRLVCEGPRQRSQRCPVRAQPWLDAWMHGCMDAALLLLQSWRSSQMEVLSSAAITESLAGGSVRGSSAEMLRPQKVLIIHHHVDKCHQTRFRW